MPMTAKTSVGYAFDYLIGLALFALVYGILNGVIIDIRLIMPDNDLQMFGDLIWRGSLVVYLVFGAFWLPSKIKIWEFWYGR